MAKEICISTTPHETRLAIIEDEQLAEIYYERENEYTLAGSIYKGRVTRVLPGMQSSFVDVGLERDAFLYVTDFLEEQEDSEEFGGEPMRRPRGSAPSGEEAERSSDRNGGREGDRGRRSAGSADGGRDGGRAGREREREQAIAPLREAVPADADLAAKGDQEPASGTRRWRGRRGRLRGVRGNMAEAYPAQAPSADTGFDSSFDEQGGEGDDFATPERGAPGGIAEIHASPASQAELASYAPVQQPRAAGRPGDRGRDRGGRGRREPYAQASTLERVSPSPDREPSVSAQPLEAPASGGAIVLPGESLSKYGSAPALPSQEPPTASVPRPAARPVNYVAPKPATLVEIAGGWDGGASLPGETLSRYVGQAGALAGPPAQVDAATEDTSTPAPAHAEELVASEHHQPIETGHAETPSAFGTRNLSEPEPNAAAGHLMEATPQTPHAEAEAVHHLDEEVEPEPVEYEPDHASASYKVSPTGPIELRLASPEAEEQEQTHAPVHEPVHEQLHDLRAGAEVEAEPVGEFSASPSAEAQTLDADWAERVREAEHDHAPAHEHAEYHAGVPELSGALAHEPPSVEPVQHELAPIEPSHPERAEWHPEPEAPHALSILHQDGTIETVLMPTPETAIHAPSLDRGFDGSPASGAAPSMAELESPLLSPEAEAHQADADRAASLTPFADTVDRMQGFAPGHGLIEEEVIDEDEYDFEPLHALHGEEHDQEDLEEETLDQQIDSAALSDAVRESHLDERLQEPSEAAEAAHEEATRYYAAEPGLGFEEVDEDEEGESQADEPTSQPQRPSRSGEDRGRGRGRSGGRNGGRSRGRSAQTQDLPVISDMLKAGQEILVQIAKEPIAKKGARITSHIALPGRFLVFMPTVSHVGVSRKIASDEERQRLKRILISEKGESSGGFIVRTAADGASEDDLRADLRFLISLWTEIKQRSDTAKAPALIYHDLNLIERILRDQVSSNFSTIWVDSEAEYERIIRFLNRFQPNLVRRVKLYTKETPLFEHFGIQEEISKALKSKVWLKSGGSIVINQTEALVAIDINTGKYVGKTARLEDTIVKTNLDAIPEIVRQIRLRDLGGIIVIDFIDMDERKNRNRVLAALEEELKNDRAPSKVLQFNDFGLVAITRKRVKQSLERTLSVQCETCTGTGMVKSPVTVCNEIYIEMRKMQKTLDGKDVMLRVHPEVVKQLKLGNGKWINELEEMVGKTIIIKSDPALHPEQFDIH